ncbi:MAG TPA: hypothetical protein VGF16_00230 [Bryobacteraceae bacterium]|jgi:hypothetical protein
MRALAGSVFVLSFVVSGWGQPRGGFVNPTPFVQGTFGNVVFPGGTAANPGVHRTFGNAAFPGGSGPHLVVPGAVTDPTFLQRQFRPRTGRPSIGFGTWGSGGVYAYPVPVYAGGGFYDNPYLGDSGAALPPPSQQQPNIMIVYPPMQQAIAPSGDNFAGASPDLAAQAAADQPAPPEPQQYLVAFKDHTIYAAVAFWVDGDTLHYFTSGNSHNQVSLSLVDKPLTERLNRESGIDMHLP